MNASWRIAKAPVTGSNGVVTAQHPAAARAGAEVLARGGNAVDAAVAATLVLSVVEPWLSGIGGGGFLLRMDRDGGAEALDFNMISSRHTRAEDYPLVDGRGGDWFDWPAVEGDRNLAGPASICVPGAVAGLGAALERYGSIAWADAVAPALAAAEAGLPVDWYTQLCIGIDAQGLSRDPAARALFLPDDTPPRLPEGRATDRRPWPAKAATLRRLAGAGWRDFYTGALAADLAADLRDAGSVIDAADLSAYAPRWAAPLRGSYRGTAIAAMPGLSGGPTVLDALGRLEGRMTPAADGPDAHAYAAFADAIRDSYAVRLNSMGHASATGDCTSHVNVVDADGTMVALTNTLLSRFGAKVVGHRTGIVLNNAMMWFDPRPGVANAIAPGVRPLSNMCPLLLTADGRPVAAMGAAGGRQIFPALLQMIAFAVDWRLPPDAVMHMPRIDASAPTIRVNRACPSATAGLIGNRHPVEVVDDVLYPVQFAVPSMIAAHAGAATGMAHPNHPWACAVAP